MMGFPNGVQGVAGSNPAVPISPEAPLPHEQRRFVSSRTDGGDTASLVLSSHASMFTGRYPHEMTADIGVPLDESHRTLAEALSENGYATAGFVANHFSTTEASAIARGFARNEDYPISVATFVELSWQARMLHRVRCDSPGAARRGAGFSQCAATGTVSRRSP
jgi:hypothetical protein